MVDTVYSLKSRFATANYRRVADRLQAACEWLNTHGLDVSHSRINAYRSCLNELARRYDAGTLNQESPKPDLPTFATAAFEAAELVYIYEGLAPAISPRLSSKLRQFIRGPVRRTSEIYDPGRDVGFELYTASRFARAGYPIDFNTDADLKVDAHGRELFVECKRPRSAKRVRKMIQEGLKQLHGRYQTADAPLESRGIFVISIGGVVLPADHFLVAETAAEVHVQTAALSAAFVRKFQSIWHQVKDKRTIGALVQLDIPAMVRSMNMFTTSHDTAVNNACPLNSSDCGLLWRIAKELARQSPPDTGGA